jgi:hypothetical protein
MSEQAVFLKGSLLRHITVMSLTASVGLMAVFVVDFVDMIFISMLAQSCSLSLLSGSGWQLRRGLWSPNRWAPVMRNRPAAKPQMP